MDRLHNFVSIKSCYVMLIINENRFMKYFRLYSLPGISQDSKHPSLRSISCGTLANLITGKFNHLINSYR